MLAQPLCFYLFILFCRRETKRLTHDERARINDVSLKVHDNHKIDLRSKAMFGLLMGTGRRSEDAAEASVVYFC